MAIWPPIDVYINRSNTLAAIILISAFLIYAYRSYKHPLRSVPGPWLTRFTRLWYFHRVYKGRFHLENIELHRKYDSDVVRVAPGWYSLRNPEKIVYGVSSRFTKSNWYDGFELPGYKGGSLFSDRNLKRHAEMRRNVQALYSLSSLVNYERYVDECGSIFIERLKEATAQGRPIDMSQWLQCYAFDVISAITYSKRFGFLDEGADIHNMMATMKKTLNWCTLVGIYSSWIPILEKASKYLPTAGMQGKEFLMSFLHQQSASRKEARARKEAKFGSAHEEDPSSMPRDFLDKMLDKQEAGERMTDDDIFIMGLNNVAAGSDTTAASLSSILHYVSTNPRVLQTLRVEIDGSDHNGDSGHVSFKESQSWPYLQAVIKESLRVHAATGVPLWRVIPDEGVTISGYFFPAGTVVGANTWVSHFDEKVWGSDVQEFKPERWIESEDVTADRIKTMEAHYMPFGLGSRTCLGRHISFMEISKIIPELFCTFDFEPEHPELRADSDWFVKPENFMVKVSLRSKET